MPRRHHKHITRVLRKQLGVIYMGQSESGAVGGLLSAVVEAPGPEQTSTATGRTRMSTTTSAGILKRFDPGELGAFKIPGVAVVKRGISGRKVGDDIFISIGTPYSKFVRKWGYNMMGVAQDGAIATMVMDQRKTLQKAAKV